MPDRPGRAPRRAMWSIAAFAFVSAVVCARAQTVRWADVLEQRDGWYASEAARRIAGIVLSYQRDSGGWPKNIDMTQPSADAANAGASDATIDNGATTTQIRLLARVGSSIAGDDGADYRGGAVRGIDYLLRAQYANGGWPQFYPLRTDYSRHITFNDDAMVRVMTLLDEAASARPPFAFVEPVIRERARDAVRRGVAVTLESQVVVAGTPTAWCAQHDEVTLAPRPARTYEHVSLSGAETVGIVRFLMTRPKTPEVVRAVDAAVDWLKQVRQADGRWARFYEIGTNRPIFSGRDGVIRYNLAEIERERREGYAWYGTWARELVTVEYERWKGR